VAAPLVPHKRALTRYCIALSGYGLSGVLRRGLIVNVNEVLRVNPPPAPTMVTLYEPVWVTSEVVMMQILANDGLPTAGLSEATAPEGSPDTDRLTI